MARLRVLVGAILTAALVLSFAAPAAAGGRTAKVRLKGSTSYSAWAVGFLTPEHGYPGFDVVVSRDG